MNLKIVYGTPRFKRPYGYEVLDVTCAHRCFRALDVSSGHTVGRWCKLPTRESAIRQCDICEREYIDITKYQDPRYETICPECVIKHDLEVD